MQESAAEGVWDVVVVGAGPAGCAAAAAAVTARPGARVLLLDRAGFPRDKVCGDGVADEVFDVLAGVGFDVAALTAGFPPVHRLQLTSPGGAVAGGRLGRPAHVVPRQVLDARLVADVLGRGIPLRRHRVRSLEVSGDGVLVDGSLRARVVIGADGAESVVRRLAGVPANRPDQVAVAIRGYAPVPADRRDVQVITMSRRRWPAYAWSFPLGDGRANVGYGHLLHGPPVGRADLLAELDRLLPGAADGITDVRGHRLPLSTGRPAVREGRVLLAGDAQSLINPLTGEGIYYAVLSGVLAGRAAVHGPAAGRLYRRSVRSALSRHLRHTDVAAALGRRPWVIDAGVAAAARDERAFDDLVDLGLTDGLLTARTLRGLVSARFR
ncbi:geranylgeranyl reductase family protein [Nakamurella endophytica]|uniref:Geranylgeranyl hydrogenase BchP n=1 Tax=Nakamurella endophytica TaxID=1748367 RepID=A0A917SRI2_9ACTN|nr:NAD(P)/FAD-dependent oxidoreductase [Nakamurella endophytica]GGL92666.1 geranylgeranyl hydrogenase BchP [Nakamurella endophytica]